VSAPPVDAAAEGATPAELLAEGLGAFGASDLPGAHRLFEKAHRRDPRWARAMSWYGVTLVLVERNSNLGVSLCDQALRLAGADPELALNQARVHLALNQRERAVRAIARGLEVSPGDAPLRAAWEVVGARRKPVLTFLARGNPINRLLGRLRHRWSRRGDPGGEPTPMNLGAPLDPPAPPRS